MLDENGIKQVFDTLDRVLDERIHRLLAAALARAEGYGGVSLVARASGLARSTIDRGLDELAELPTEIPITPPHPQRIRRPGGGRKATTEIDPSLRSALEKLLQPVTRGDPESPLLWSSKSLRKLTAELQQQGHPVSRYVVRQMLQEMEYSLQANCKTNEGASDPDRDAQFQYINRRVKEFQWEGQPVISVDTKKKELVGEFRNPGREWRPEGSPEEVNVYDFVNKELGKAIPYGVYDLGANQGWVGVGVDHDTAEFAVETIRRWWQQMGSPLYPNARKLMITADGGGSNSSTSTLWKVQLQQLSDETGLQLLVCHLPPGTSKWNKIEHRMFSEITKHWRGRPLVSHEVIINLIADTTTSEGLKIRAELDPGSYPIHKRPSAVEVSDVHLHKRRFHGEWNYGISPRAL